MPHKFPDGLQVQDLGKSCLFAILSRLSFAYFDAIWCLKSGIQTD
jgi:hypothetical protein